MDKPNSACKKRSLEEVAQPSCSAKRMSTGTGLGQAVLDSLATAPQSAEAMAAEVGATTDELSRALEREVVRLA